MHSSRGRSRSVSGVQGAGGGHPGLTACDPEGDCPGQRPYSVFFGCMPCSEVGSLEL